MTGFPSDFPQLYDSGGIGEGHPLGGFGGNAAKDQAHHRTFIKSSLKAPVVLVHGNTGTAIHPQWGWLKVVSHLKNKFGYADEHFWALSYLGSGQRQLEDPYTRNIEDLRTFTDTVRAYLNIDCVDMVGHSLGCHLILCYLAGLKKQGAPIKWDQGPRYANVGTVVLIDGAMKGLKSMAMTNYDEWIPTHDVYQCLSPDNTPFGRNDNPTPPPKHNVKYWCCMVPGGFVDGMDYNSGTTGHLNGADENRNYNSGSGHSGHEKVKDDPAIISDWAPFLNTVPPAPQATITVDKDSGNYSRALTIHVSIDPPATPVDYQATRIKKQIVVGVLENIAAETLNGTLTHGQALTLSTDGMWEVGFKASGAPDMTVTRTYGIDITLPQTEIITDNSVDFENNLMVIAQADRGTLYMNVGSNIAEGWEKKASVTITENTEVKAIAITENGIASELVSKRFRKKVSWTDQALGTVVEHYVAGRLDLNGFFQYGSKYGYIQSFALYKISGEWTDDLEKTTLDNAVPMVSCSHDSGTYTEPINIKLSAVDADDPAPCIFYTVNGSTPTTSSNYFVNQGTVRFDTQGMKTLKYLARDRSGNTTPVVTKEFDIQITDVQPMITSSLPSGVVYKKSVTLRISGVDDIDPDVTIYYSQDGTVPDENSQSFVNSAEFEIIGNGNHAISCFAKDSVGNEKYEVFCYTVHGTNVPVTTIFPNGCAFTDSVEVYLNTEEPVEWIKYTTDGSDPGEINGIVYDDAFILDETATVKYRSKDKQGNLGEVKSAFFIHDTEPKRVVFENIAGVDGYIKAMPDGTFRSVVDSTELAIGAGWDGRISRSIISFDTSGLPQTANITQAWLQVRYFAGWGNPWDGRDLKIDVKTGKFGSASTCEKSDWDEEATATGVATIAPFSFGCKDSSSFNEEGRNAINASGRTQMRLYFDHDADMGFHKYLFLTKGDDIKLIVEYTDP